MCLHRQPKRLEWVELPDPGPLARAANGVEAKARAIPEEGRSHRSFLLVAKAVDPVELVRPAVRSIQITLRPDRSFLPDSHRHVHVKTSTDYARLLGGPP